MSKKYVIEMFEGTQMIMQIGTDTKDRVETIAVSADDLEELNSDYINEHFSELQDTAYQRGVEDGQNETWEAAKKIEFGISNGGIPTDVMKEIFGTYMPNKVLRKFTAAEAIAKLKSYEEKQKADDEIKVGDEVIYNGTTKCIVVRPEDNERYASLIDCDGTHYSAEHRECKKTGRHFDIEEILEEMKA